MIDRHAVRRPLLLVTLLVGVTGCESILGVGREERTAVLVTDPRLTIDGKGALVVDADTVAVGQLVPVRIRTAGGGCIRRAFVDVKSLSDGVELRP